MSTALQLDGMEPWPGPPLGYYWNEPHQPLPRRTVRAPARCRAHPLLEAAPPWLATGTVGQPFDFCGHVQRLCADIVARCEALRHIDVSRLLFAVTQARSSRRHGLQARVTPLRFHGGRLIRHRRGLAYQVQRYFVNGREMLYLVTFYLPRFLDQTFDDKFITLFHELFHISPTFDGDLRRHAGRCALHTRSKRRYDAHMADLARAYLANGAEASRHDFLRLDFHQLEHRHGSIIGIHVPRPKLIPLVNNGSPKLV